jgi:hypothetical protein
MPWRGITAVTPVTRRAPQRLDTLRKCWGVGSHEPLQPLHELRCGGFPVLTRAHVGVVLWCGVAGIVAVHARRNLREFRSR